MTWRDEVETAIECFVKVAALADHPIARTDLTTEYLPAPHRQPSKLPVGMMAVYGFYHDRTWLKIGKAGPKSNARYTSQHYNANSARSTLAGSLVRDTGVQRIPGFDSHNPGSWIRAATSRFNILLSSERPLELLSLLEAFLHLRLRPKYEG